LNNLIHSTCPLCQTSVSTLKLQKKNGETYWDCSHCGLIFLDKNFFLTPEEERARYCKHNNDVHDLNYQKFVSPAVDFITANIPTSARGLDFGSGSGPVVSFMLQKQNFHVRQFDPFFCNDQDVLKLKYDFIVSTEVIEHFHRPEVEFSKLESLLQPNGKLILMTDLYDDVIDFASWYYHQDQTHVSFYRMQTFEWIKNAYSFVDLRRISSRTVVFYK
jgi:hypothetical protein